MNNEFQWSHSLFRAFLAVVCSNRSHPVWLLIIHCSDSSFQFPAQILASNCCGAGGSFSTHVNGGADMTFNLWGLGGAVESQDWRWWVVVLAWH